MNYQPHRYEHSVWPETDMKPDQVQLLRKLALNESEAMNLVMSGQVSNSCLLEPRTASLVRIAALLSVDSDPSTFQWATELGLAAGADDDDLIDTLVIIAPIIGIARLTSALPHLMSALGVEIVE